MTMCASNSKVVISWSEWRTKNMARFRTHYLTKELAYVRTQNLHNSKRDALLIEINVSKLPDLGYACMPIPSSSRGCEIAPCFWFAIPLGNMTKIFG